MELRRGWFMEVDDGVLVKFVEDGHYLCWEESSVTVLAEITVWT